ncbi:hypothetical protein [Streptomyces melanogenes]|uniref:hypothetical protein n=1 Tax=Streptomyces melanogenes TaxID=67326 RepID=UPI00167D50C3|nr:hypothetical protein [Streptomyces melanogenes]GGP33390.1 hypothetical protein GCM10010278_06920 [Streptomyces melanogenes]
MKPLAEDGRSATEDRVRAALAARAALVTHRDLSHEAPPQGRSWGVRRVRRVAFAALGVAAAAVTVCLLVLPGGPAPAQAPPAGTPGITEPSTPTDPVDPSGADPRVITEP